MFEKVFTLQWMHRVLAGGLVISYLLAAYGMFRTNLIPGKYLLPSLLVPGVIVALLVFVYVTKKLSVSKTITLGIISLLVIIGNLYLFSLGSATAKFFDAIQSDGYTYEEYRATPTKNTVLSLKKTATLNSATKNT
jgi:hypothetical protein